MTKNDTPTLSAAIEGQYLVIRVPLHAPRPSTSGKTLVVASSNGNQATTATVDGKPIIVGCNAYIRK